MSARDLLTRERPAIVGILNLTPDSFSADGIHARPDAALEQARRMVAEGAEMIDVGGESTRPGAERVPAKAQLERIAAVIEALRAELPPMVPISVDTTRVEVAAGARAAGAEVVNDVSAGRESEMFALAAERGVPIILMHMQGTPATMQADPRYEDVVREVRDFLLARAAAAEAAGVPPEDIVIDPGIGFGKTRPHNLALVAHLDTLVATGYPVMLGASRKRFMGSICAETEYHQLVGATCATTALAVLAGVRLLRVHDVRPNRQAMEVALAIHAARESEP